MRRINNKAVLVNIARKHLYTINLYKRQHSALTLVAGLPLRITCTRRAKVILSDYLKQTLWHLLFLNKCKRVRGLVVRIQEAYQQCLNRKRRKRNLLRVFWDAIVRNCVDLIKD